MRSTGRRCASSRARRSVPPRPRPRARASKADSHPLVAQVWSIRVDVHFLDDEGNMLDCASIAAMTALRHFRKPDATVVGEEVTIVRLSLSLPLSLVHVPRLTRRTPCSTR